MRADLDEDRDELCLELELLLSDATVHIPVVIGGRLANEPLVIPLKDLLQRKERDPADWWKGE